VNRVQLLVEILALPARQREHVGVLLHPDGQLTDLHVAGSQRALSEWARLVLLDGGPRDGAVPHRARLERREVVVERIEAEASRGCS